VSESPRDRPPHTSASVPAGTDPTSGSGATAGSPPRKVVSTRKGDTVALMVGTLLTCFLIGWLIWASVRNITRDRALVASELVSG
jgi:hypothetical protein